MARVGPHISRVYATGKHPTIVDHLEVAFAEAEQQGFMPRAASFFIMGPKDRTVHLQKGEPELIQAFVERTGTVLVAHSTYRNTNPWRGDPTSAASLRQEATLCADAGILGLVVHLPVGPQDWVLKFLPRLYSASRTRIYLEHVASLPKNSHYETPAKLAALFRGIRRFDPTLLRVGFCIDTAHLWACGVDISSYSKAEQWLNDLEAISDVLPDKIMIHLNDNRHGLGAGKDEHSALLEGAIWSSFKDYPSRSGLAAFVDYATRNRTIVILERKPPEKLLSDYRALLELQPGLGLKAASAAAAPPKTGGPGKIEEQGA